MYHNLNQIMIEIGGGCWNFTKQFKISSGNTDCENRQDNFKKSEELSLLGRY